MKLTEPQKQNILINWGEWESFHFEYDKLMEKRLKELDPEFLEELKKLKKGAIFWYA